MSFDANTVAAFSVLVAYAILDSAEILSPARWAIVDHVWRVHTFLIPSLSN